MGVVKRTWTRDTHAAIPLLVWVIVGIGAVAIAGLGVYQITQRPDIIYNISDTGFSLAGVDVSWLWVIAIVGGVVILIVFMGRRRPEPPRYYPPPPRY